MLSTAVYYADETAGDVSIRLAIQLPHTPSPHPRLITHTPDVDVSSCSRFMAGVKGLKLIAATLAMTTSCCLPLALPPEGAQTGRSFCNSERRMGDCGVDCSVHWRVPSPHNPSLLFTLSSSSTHWLSFTQTQNTTKHVLASSVFTLKSKHVHVETIGDRLKEVNHDLGTKIIIYPINLFSSINLFLSIFLSLLSVFAQM